MEDGDRNFVISSWLRSYADQQHGMSRPCFFRLYEPLVVSLVDTGIVMVAGLADVPGAILGWLAAGDSAVHYVYTKPRWRRLGVAKQLLRGSDQLAIAYTHEPPAWATLPARWSFDPLARFGDP